MRETRRWAYLILSQR